MLPLFDYYTHVYPMWPTGHNATQKQCNANSVRIMSTWCIPLLFHCKSGIFTEDNTPVNQLNIGLNPQSVYPQVTFLLKL